MSVKVTDEGKSLLENAVLQGDKVVFSQMELIADTEKSPTEMIKRVDVSSISAADNHTIVVKAQVDNAGFSDTYYFSRVNVYVGKVLFAYDDGCYIFASVILHSQSVFHQKLQKCLMNWKCG